MRKLNKILLGALSILTLGLFVFTGAKVNAAADYSVTAEEVVSATDLVVPSDDNTSGTTKDLSSYTIKNIFNFGNKWAVHKSSKTYTNYSDSTQSDTFSYSVKASAARTVTLSLTENMGDFTVYVYAYAVADNVTLKIGNGDESTISKSTAPTVYEGTVNSTNNTIVAGKSVCINAIYLVKKVTTPSVEVTALQQEAVEGGSTYIRFIFIVSNDTTLSTADFASKLTLILDDGQATKQTVIRSPKAYNKLTLAGNTYAATVKGNDYTFDNAENPNDIYVVYVVQFTTETYAGHNVKASLNVGGTEYKTSGYDFD